MRFLPFSSTPTPLFWSIFSDFFPAMDFCLRTQTPIFTSNRSYYFSVPSVFMYIFLVNNEAAGGGGVKSEDRFNFPQKAA